MIHAKNSRMFLRTFVGECEDNQGNKYELSTNTVTGEPVIRSRQTDKTFTLSWHDLMKMAIQEGLDVEAVH